MEHPPIKTDYGGDDDATDPVHVAHHDGGPACVGGVRKTARVGWHDDLGSESHPKPSSVFYPFLFHSASVPSHFFSF